MSEKKTLDSYEVGYGKPPKNTRFRKGISGNPRGRTKRAPDFDTELLRESRSLININDNGQRRRISKLQGIVKQLTNKAMTGNIPAARIYFDLYQEALERVALVAGPQPSDHGRYNDVKNFTEEELMRIIAADLKRTEQ